MIAEEYLLAALVAPGSAEAEIGRVQAGIFREHGLLSAQALPPLIPVAFLPDPPPRGLLSELNGAVRAGWRMSVTGPNWVGGFLFIGIRSGQAWAGLRERALSLCGTEPRRLFPPAEGFFLGCGDASEEQRRLIRPVLPVLSFTSCQVALMSVSSPRGDGEWWRELYWETVEELPLRGRRER
jgi:hypothetical protein